MTKQTEPLPRQSMIGIIGGGQLGRMLAIAAGRLGYETTVLDPQPDCPASQMTNRHIVAAYDDHGAIVALAKSCQVVTYEFENVDVSAIEAIADRVPVYPPTEALAISQDRLTEKAFLNRSGLATAPWHDCPDASALTRALEDFGGRGILKTRRFGYDGKGQIRFSSSSDTPCADKAIETLAGAPAILEGFVDFACEISVIVTRAQDGTTHCFDPAENGHVNGILATSSVPAAVSDTVITEAKKKAETLANALSYVGTLGLEFFVTKEATLIANEFAPRVHNSGHWTEAACSVSQFEQHIRAVTGLPLAFSTRHSDCTMHNLIGDQIMRINALYGERAVILHDYGKSEVKPGRKMGHYTVLKTPG